MENNVQAEVALPKETQKTRYALLDELRGFLVLCMIFYHGFLSVYDVLGLEAANFLFEFFTPVEPFFASAFIMLSGMMCGFSRSNLLRGIKCFGVAVAITIVTMLGSEFLGDIAIRFGILHLLGFSMILCGALNFIFKRTNKWVGIIIALLLFFVFYGVPTDYTDIVGIRNIIPQEWYFMENLYPFGITTPDFYSADYFPILPWTFLFIAGYFLYKFNIPQKFSRVFEPKRIKPLGFLGRHALLIYVVHQPIIYLICAPFAV
jgi:uncharacterized membrane protein